MIFKKHPLAFNAKDVPSNIFLVLRERRGSCYVVVPPELILTLTKRGRVRVLSGTAP
jgi:hypothetical protein